LLLCDTNLVRCLLAHGPQSATAPTALGRRWLRRSAMLRACKGHNKHSVHANVSCAVLEAHYCTVVSLQYAANSVGDMLVLQLSVLTIKHASGEGGHANRAQHMSLQQWKNIYACVCVSVCHYLYKACWWDALECFPACWCISELWQLEEVWDNVACDERFTNM
jgi:hypothetical protein